MSKKILWVILFVASIGALYMATSIPAPVVTPKDTTTPSTPADTKDSKVATERYSARVDRVDVVFEHYDYTRYRLATNGLVREGELNTERGFEADIDATVFVLNWQKPEGEQIRYVRLSSNPTHLYFLDSEQKIVTGSALSLERAKKDITGFTWLHKDSSDVDALFLKTDVSLIIKSQDGTQEEQKIATVEGSCNEMPVETPLALDSKQLLCYYAGFGYQFRVIGTDTGYEVQQRELEEASPDYNPPIADFKTVMRIATSN